MSHAIRNGVAVCLEPETALCRASWDYDTCGCETFGETWRNPDGTWTHLAFSEYPDDDAEHVSTGVYAASNCNICNWLNEDLASTGPGETWAAGAGFYDVDLPDGDIAVEWEGDYYVWDYTDPRVIGGLIGRLTVARWADDRGLAS